MRIELNGHERRMAREYGLRIYKQKVSDGVITAKVDKQRSDEALNVIGVGSEMAVKKYFNMDYIYEYHKVRDNGDLFLAGKRWDVKCGRITDHMLKVQIKHFERNDDEGYIFIKQENAMSLQWWQLVGFIRKASFNLAKKKICFHGYETKPMYCIEESELHNITQLREEHFAWDRARVIRQMQDIQKNNSLF